MAVVARYSAQRLSSSRELQCAAGGATLAAAGKAPRAAAPFFSSGRVSIFCEESPLHGKMPVSDFAFRGEHLLGTWFSNTIIEQHARGVHGPEQLVSHHLHAATTVPPW